MEKLLAAVLSLALLLSLACAAEAEGPSNWAVYEVSAAIELGIVPAELQGEYQAPITRVELVDAVMTFLAVQYRYDLGRSEPFEAFYNDYCRYRPGPDGQSLPAAHHPDGAAPFQDIGKLGFSQRGKVDLAYRLGIVTGRSEDVFDPDGRLTRQEAAAILMRTYQNYGGDFLPGETAAAFSDWDAIAPWAQPQAATLAALGVLKGDQGANFRPLDLCTREQMYLALYRLYALAPVSRAQGNIPPLPPPEEKVKELTDNYFWHWEPISRLETPDCVIVYGHRGLRHAEFDYALWVVYKSGGWFDAVALLRENFGENDGTPLEGLTLDESGGKLRFFKTHTDGSVTHYELNLETGRIKGL